MTEIIRKNPDEAAQWMMSREQSTLLQEGEKMKHESVKHVRYGTGRVAEVVQNHMVVLFDGEAGRKVFPYPDAFERFLCFDDPILQKRAEAAVMPDTAAKNRSPPRLPSFYRRHRKLWRTLISKNHQNRL